MQLKDLKWLAGWNLSFFCSLHSSAFSPISTLVVQSLRRVWLCSPVDYCTSGSSVFQCLPEFAQIHVHWVSDAIQPSHPVSPFSSCSQSFPASGFFPVSRLFASGGQRIGASASVLPMNIQGWFPLGLTGLISLFSKGLSRAFFSNTIWKHQFFGAQPSLWIHIEHYQHLNPSQSFPIIILLSCNDSLNFMKGNTFSKVMYCTL